MIRITDRTFSCLDSSEADRSDLMRLLELMIETEVEGIELSEKMYHLLSPLPSYPGYVVRIQRPSDIEEYLDIPRYAGGAKIRVHGLDGVLPGDYLAIFQSVREAFPGDVEFCPGNRFHTATALAAEWVTNNIGDSVVTSFGGIGCFAPTEELIIFLKLRGLRKVSKEYPFFPEMADVLSKVTGTPVRHNKPILGRRIFHVESGIHVDGIIKRPKCYEPFPPDVVGQTRKVILGKQSGAASVKAKLEEMGLNGCEELIPQFLKRVKTTAAKKNSELTNNEFYDIVKECSL